jgi:hypothetical protein
MDVLKRVTFTWYNTIKKEGDLLYEFKRKQKTVEENY